MDDGLGGDIAAGARPVLDDEGLAKTLRQPLSYQPRDDVVSAAGCEADDHAHRPRRIGLRPCSARDGRERRNARGQMQEFAAGKFHAIPSYAHERKRYTVTRVQPSGVSRSCGRKRAL